MFIQHKCNIASFINANKCNSYKNYFNYLKLMNKLLVFKFYPVHTTLSIMFFNL